MSDIEHVDIADFLDHLCTASLRPEAHKSAKMLANLYKMTAAEIRRLREERRWVPVGERLPEEGVEALWWCNSDDQDRGVYVGKRDRSLIVWGSHEWFIDADFTHWMPLPPGPEAAG